MRTTSDLISTRAPTLLVCRSRAMSRVRETAGGLARGRQRVLITGESGVGKDLVARFIHQRSSRSGGPFITVAATGVPELTLTAQLFGDAGERAVGRRSAFAGSDSGTLFLDEVGDLPLSVQCRLVRALEDGVALPTGRRASVRVLASTTRNLPDLVSAGRFREDLMFRLRAAHVHVPPLRDRRDDVRPLTEWRFAHLPRHVDCVQEAWTALEHYYWPGNVRELVNVVEQATATAAGDLVRFDDLPESIRGYGGDGIRPRNERRRYVADELYTALVGGRAEFWRDVYDVFICRDLTREDVRGIVRRGLVATRGSYRALLALFGMDEDDYKRLHNFLAAHDCAIDFRPFRSLRRDAARAAIASTSEDPM